MIIGSVLLICGLYFLLLTIVSIINNRTMIKAEIYEMPSSAFRKYYPYLVKYEYNQQLYEVEKQRYGYPLFGKTKIILINRQEPKNIVFVLVIVFNLIVGVFFVIIAIGYLLVH